MRWRWSASHQSLSVCTCVCKHVVLSIVLKTVTVSVWYNFSMKLLLFLGLIPHWNMFYLKGVSFVLVTDHYCTEWRVKEMLYPSSACFVTAVGSFGLLYPEIVKWKAPKHDCDVWDVPLWAVDTYRQPNQDFSLAKSVTAVFCFCSPERAVWQTWSSRLLFHS